MISMVEKPISTPHNRFVFQNGMVLILYMALPSGTLHPIRSYWFACITIWSCLLSSHEDITLSVCSQSEKFIHSTNRNEVDQVWSILPALELLPLDCSRRMQKGSRTFMLLFGVIPVVAPGNIYERVSAAYLLPMPEIQFLPRYLLSVWNKLTLYHLLFFSSNSLIYNIGLFHVNCHWAQYKIGLVTSLIWLESL